ncbi:MAG TPA: LysR family transcriptional regulator [Steroidobacteraceae bacterium]|nr:LysR family transcriptional regulator [Steroidobacteraceae bacterium]
MNTLESMQVFMRVAEQASFTRAADSLGLLKATVSQAVAQLENSLGTRLLHRTTRKVQMTLDGHAYYDRCKELLADVESVQTMFQRSGEAVRGRLRVDLPLRLARSYVIPRLPEFLRAHPQIEFELSTTDRLVDPVQEGFDCVLRVGASRDPQLIARPVGQLEFINVASADYLQRRGTPRTLEDLATHDLVHYTSVLGSRSEGFEYPGGEGGFKLLAMSGPVVVNSSDAYHAACLAGLGIIQAPELGMREELARGEVVEILPQLIPAPMPVSLLYAHRRNLPKRVRVFMDWVAEVVQPVLAPRTPAASALSPRTTR